MIRLKQGDTIPFSGIANNWVVRDYLPSLVKGTELHSIILNFNIANNDLSSSIDVIDVLDAVDVRITRNGKQRLIDTRAGDLLRIAMIKNKSNYNNIAVIAASSNYDVEIPIPFTDRSRPNPKDTSLSVDALKSFQLELRYNSINNIVISDVETMITFENKGNSLRINSLRHIITNGINFTSPGDRQSYPISEAHRSLGMIVGDRSNITYLQVDGERDTLFEGEPDELIASSNDLLEINPPDTAITASGMLLTDRCIPLPFITHNGGYGESEQQKLNIKFSLAGGGFSGYFIEDYVVMPDGQRISDDAHTAIRDYKPSDYKINAVDRTGRKLSAREMSKAVVLPQIKLSKINSIPKALNPETSKLNIEASMIDL